MRKPNEKEIGIIRAIAENHKIQGCRMIHHAVLVGKRSIKMTEEKALAFHAEIQEAGFYIDSAFLQGEIFDCFLIQKRGKDES